MDNLQKLGGVNVIVNEQFILTVSTVLIDLSSTNYLYWVPDFFHIVTIICKPLVYCCYPSEIILLNSLWHL